MCPTIRAQQRVGWTPEDENAIGGSPMLPGRSAQLGENIGEPREAQLRRSATEVGSGVVSLSLGRGSLSLGNFL